MGGACSSNERAAKSRLIDLNQIRAEKISRSPAWIYGKIASGDFPRPLPGNTSKNLWEEDQVDRFVEGFIASAKASQLEGSKQQRTAKARGAPRKQASSKPAAA